MTEYWQFAGAAVAFVVVAILWLRLIYLPGRTLERREDGGPATTARTSSDDRTLVPPDSRRPAPVAVRTARADEPGSPRRSSSAISSGRPRLRATRVHGHAGRRARRRPHAQRPRLVRGRLVSRAGGVPRSPRSPRQRVGLAPVSLLGRRPDRPLRGLRRSRRRRPQAGGGRSRRGRSHRRRTSATRRDGDPVAGGACPPGGPATAVPDRRPHPALPARSQAVRPQSTRTAPPASPAWSSGCTTRERPHDPSEPSSDDRSSLTSLSGLVPARWSRVLRSASTQERRDPRRSGSQPASREAGVSWTKGSPAG